MSALVGALGAAMLAASTLPQAWRLLRTRSATEFGWPFVALNLVGLLFLASRSWELGERAFVAVNLLGAAFWVLVAVIKLAPGAKAGLARAPRGLPATR